MLPFFQNIFSGFFYTSIDGKQYFTGQNIELDDLHLTFLFHCAR